MATIRLPDCSLSAIGMHDADHRRKKRRMPRRSAPRQPFSPAAGLTLPGTSQAAFHPEPETRNGLSLPCNKRSLRNGHSRINAPGLLLRFPASQPLRPLAFQLRRRFPVSPGYQPLQRLRRVTESPTSLAACVSHPHSPPGLFESLGIKAFNGYRRPPARLPKLPDLPSLPAADFYY